MLIKNVQLLINIPTTELITSMCYVAMVPTGENVLQTSHFDLATLKHGY